MHRKKKYRALAFLFSLICTIPCESNGMGAEDVLKSFTGALEESADGYPFLRSTHDCTVFLASDDENVLAGNNEDWSDSNSCFWIIPPADGKHGWIKFGFAGGFPQGGMNDEGLFWDGTGCAYLEMPVAESAKQKFPGPLMQKVVEECASIAEARQVFQRYYCDDQYKSQYLIGDASGQSMIVEGDEIVSKKSFYQVATNFYHSHPELGGFPCERYDKAVSMLENSTELSVPFLGQILSETHQEGKYPTQYSTIYDLKEAMVYLIHHHHFEEYLPIDLERELGKGYRMYYIAELFSEVTPESPAPNERTEAAKVKFMWSGKRNSSYQLLYSTDAAFTQANGLSVIRQRSKLFDRGFAGILLLGIITAGGVLRRNRKRFAFLAILIGVFFFTMLCHLDEHVNPTDNPVEDFQITVNDLEPNTTYYWKIVARTEGGHDFKTESVARSFRTGP